MRGGTSYIANRYGKANNKYMKVHDENAPPKYIVYLDANNLYCHTMSQYLQTDLAKYKENSKKGLVLEVDLEYPKELHDLHNDYPLGPEQLNVTEICCQRIMKK